MAKFVVKFKCCLGDPRINSSSIDLGLIGFLLEGPTYADASLKAKLCEGLEIFPNQYLVSWHSIRPIHTGETFLDLEALIGNNIIQIDWEKDQTGKINKANLVYALPKSLEGQIYKELCF